MTKEEFKNSGRFIYRDSFLEKNPNTILHTDCTDVVEYQSGAFIQLLKSGLFYLEDDLSSKSLDEVEDRLWDIIEGYNQRLSLEKIEEWKENYKKKSN
jgi:hypothetical protein